MASAADCTGASAWDATTLYSTGDQVRHPDSDEIDALWEAALDSRNAEPSRSSAYWDYVDDCDGTGGGGNEAPTASFTTDVSTPEPGQDVTFDASGSSDPDGSIASYDWDFGDGTTGSGETTTHSYDSSGDYTVTLTVTDDAGATGTDTTTVSVSDGNGGNEAPNASFTVSPSSPDPGESATFDAADSSDSDGSISSYAWDFGDGSSGSGQTVSHSYASEGDYTVTLTVTDDDGATDSNATTVSVQTDSGGGGGACDGVPQWDPDTAYSGGDQVTYEGDLFTAEWWTRGDEPDDSKSVWTLESACDGSGGGGDPVDRTLEDVVPKPADVTTSDAQFEIDADTTIALAGDEPTAEAEYLAELLRPTTGFELPIETASEDTTNSIVLEDLPVGQDGAENYDLTVTEDDVTISSPSASGVFIGVQTLRQVLPAAVEADTEQNVDWIVPGGEIDDHPRFEHRGTMLDVARHFFDVSTVEEFIDQVAMYKINRLHLHLTDDQGWRIEIDGWPNLTDEGADSEVGGGPGGYFTVSEYQDIIQYAQDRHMTVIPEIDMPGHTGAALESYAELNCDDTKRDEDTGTNVGDTALCLDAEHEETTYQFVEDVIDAVAEITDGPYLHVGGDEADVLSDAEYEEFVDTVLPMVQNASKIPIGWHQIADTDPVDNALIQFWGTNGNAPSVAEAANAGHEIIVSPASRAYLDMDYNWQDGMGQNWAGRISVQDSYTWDPGSYIDGVDESSIAGVEGPLWTEFVETQDDIEYMVFPRLASLAELGWTSQADADWSDFQERLALQGPRWDQLDVGFYQSDQIDWP